MKILTTAEFVEGKIPKGEDFVPALKQFEADCVLAFLGGSVLGSFAYGSVNRNDFNVASDIDYLMVIRDPGHKDKVREATRRAYDERRVYIQTRVVQENLAREGFHNLDESFRQHLELNVAQHGYNGENPLDVLAQTGVPFEEALLRSMAGYMMKLNNGFTTHSTSEVEYVDFLKDIMEKPFHAVRVAIQYAYGTVAPEDEEDFQDTKPELLRIYETLNPDGELLADLHELGAVGRDYVSLLELRQSGDVAKCEAPDVYREILDRMFDCYPVAVHFVEQNAMLMKA